MVPRRSDAFVPRGEGIIFLPGRCLTREAKRLLKNLKFQEKMMTQLLFLEAAFSKDFGFESMQIELVREIELADKQEVENAKTVREFSEHSSN